MVRAKWLCFYLYLTSAVAALAAVLPIHMEDSHAGSFGFFARTLELNEEYTLILYDAHSDASAIANSDAIRTQLRRVVSLEQRDTRLDTWRRQGTIQPHNWIEPLMPRPISKVVWVAAPELSPEKRHALQAEAAKHLDWLDQVTPRKAGSLSARFIVTDELGLSAHLDAKTNKIISIDLDYFASASTPVDQLEKIWQRSLQTPQLKALSIAVSRPWLKDEAQARALSSAAIQLALSVRNAHFHFEPFPPQAAQTSEQIKALYLEGKQAPHWDLSNITPTAKSCLVNYQESITTRYQPNRFEKLLLEWKGLAQGYQIELDQHQVSTDGVWRCDGQRLPHIRLKGAPAHCSVQWYQISDKAEVYNILPQLLAGKAFTPNSSSYLTEETKLVATTESPALAARTWKQLLPHQQQWGAIRLQAIVTTESGSYATPVTHIRVGTRSGFHKALAEQFGSSYVFGIGTLAHRGESGPETLLGNDCANFLIYAFRRVGHAIPWCNPAQLRRHLEPLYEKQTLSSRPAIAQDLITNGLVIHLGSHVAAVWKDLAPIGVLDPHDLVVHHLSGPPEILTLEALMEERRHYALYTLPQPTSKPLTLTFAGDLNLAARHSPIDTQPTWLPAIREADFSIANLECCFSSTPKTPSSKRFVFRASPDRATLITSLGIDAVSLANNHSSDAGADGIRETLQALKDISVHSFGLNNSLVNTIEVAGLKVALLGINCIETDHSPQQMCCWPRDKDTLRASLHAAKNSSDLVIVMPHWGEEYTERVTEAQRHLARWLIRQGADAVIGSHSHCPQPLDYYQGRPICYSLGNLWFPNNGPKGFDITTLCKLQISSSGSILHSSTTSYSPSEEAQN